MLNISEQAYDYICIFVEVQVIDWMMLISRETSLRQWII